MAKILSKIFSLSCIFLITNTCLFCQIGGQTYDSLIIQSKSKTDTVRLKSLIRLTWENRYSDPLKSFEYGFEGLALAEKLKKGKEIATIHNYLGVLATKIKSYDKAEINIKKAFYVADSLNILIEKAYALNNLGEIYKQTGRVDSAVISQTQAIEIFKSIKNLNGLAYSYNQLGLTMLSIKNYDEAVKYHKLTLEIRKIQHDSIFITKTLQNIGVDLLEKGSFYQARQFFNSMETKQIKTQDKFSVPYYYILIGKTYQGENQTQIAIKYYKQGFALADSLDLYFEMCEATKHLSGIYKKMADYKTALMYLSIYNAMEDSSKRLNLVEEYKQLEMKITFDQKYKYLEYKMQQDIDNQKLKLFWSRILILGSVVFLIVLLIFFIVLKKNFSTIANKNTQLLIQKQEIEAKNEAIIEQRDELEVANATKDKFFSIIAHDLRGPIGNFLNFTSMVIDYHHDEINEKLMNFLKIINSSAEQTSALLDNLLTWARTQQGAIGFDPRTFNLTAIFFTNIELLKVRADDKKITIHNLLPVELICDIDYYMIDTVIRNLISNAIKFTSSDGNIQLMGSIEDNFVKIKIIDSGIGMSKKDMEQIFRIDIKHKSKDGTNGEKGTGLGLILCKEFIEKHKGKIWVESEPGKGSSFIFTLPRNINYNI